ncbi:MAG TPA: flagellar FlbD family protein [Terriglobales bacterium]|nr:flagellar FlbD family protein [Terriglobales bacterium]
MIRLTRLNSQPIAVNSDLIKFIENAHDTVLTLLSGEKVIVKERTEEVIDRIIAFRRTVLAGLPAVNPSLAAGNTSHTPDQPDSDSSSEMNLRG